MKIKYLISLLLVASLLGAPTQAQANPFGKVLHVIEAPVKKAAKVVGTTLLYIGAGVAVVAFCAKGGCS